MEKIDLNDFLRNLDIILNYAMTHLTKEDWYDWTEDSFVDHVFDAMQYNVIAMSKCLEYMEILENYNEFHDKRESVFLDVRKN